MADQQLPAGGAMPPAPPPDPNQPVPQGAQPLYTWQQPDEVAGPAPGIRWAGYGARLVAYILDGLVIAGLTIAASIVLLILLAIFLSGGSNGLAAVTGLVWVAVIIVLTLAYFPYFWSRGGQTPGMRVLRIRVVRDRDGGPVTGGQAVIRLVGYWISGAAFYLGYIWIFIDGRRRGWHDLIAGTVVVEA
jgi:uncharacterized RDD family membrane protein YckC